MAARKSRSRIGRSGALRRRRSAWLPIAVPVTVSFRYALGDSTSLGSTGWSNAKCRFETLPAGRDDDAITICGCSTSTSTWRITVADTGGADASDSRFVTCDSASVVARSAESTSCERLQTTGSSRPGRPLDDEPLDVQCGSPSRSARGRRRCAGGRAGRRARARPARSASSTGRPRTRPRRPASWSRPGCPVATCSRRRRAGSRRRRGVRSSSAVRGVRHREAAAPSRRWRACRPRRVEVDSTATLRHQRPLATRAPSAARPAVLHGGALHALGQAQAEHQPLDGARARRPAAPWRAAGRAAPALAARYGARRGALRRRTPSTVPTAPTPEAEVVAAQPVGAVVPRLAARPREVGASRTTRSRRASSRSMTRSSAPPAAPPAPPARPVAVREARAGLRLELVAGAVVGLEGEQPSRSASSSARSSPGTP